MATNNYIQGIFYAKVPILKFQANIWSQEGKSEIWIIADEKQNSKKVGFSRVAIMELDRWWSVQDELRP